MHPIASMNTSVGLLNANLDDSFYDMEGNRCKFIAESINTLRESIGLSVEENLPGNLITYLAKSCEDLSPNYLNTLLNLAKQLGPTPKDSLVSVVIPVAALEESRNIYTTLESYSNQSLDEKNFDIVLFLNRPEGSLGSIVETSSEIERFKNDFPEINVRVCSGEIAEHHLNIGYIRKTITDCACFTIQDLEHDLAAWKHIIVRADADTKGVEADHLLDIVDTFRCNPSLLYLKGHLDWDPEQLAKDPYLFLGTRAAQIFDTVLSLRYDSIGGGGANFACRAASYIGAFGYDPECELGEDVGLGRSLNALHHEMNSLLAGSSNRILGSTKTRNYTSTRRSEAAIRAGKSPFEQWDGDTNFQISDPEIRTEEVHRIDLARSGELDIKFCERIITGTLKVYANMEDRERCMELLSYADSLFGFKTILTSEGEVEIVETGSLKEHLALGMRNCNRRHKRLTNQEVTKRRAIDDSWDVTKLEEFFFSDILPSDLLSEAVEETKAEMNAIRTQAVDAFEALAEDE